ncbi:MAG: 4-alpha-glucanotransferase [Rikenellaceae bacterium]
MRLKLKIDYHTSNGEFVSVDCKGEKCFLKNVGGATKLGELTVDNDDVIEYTYSVGDRKEWGKAHFIKAAKSVTSCCVIDRWQDMPKNSIFYTSLFTQSVFKRSNPKESILENDSIVVAVSSPLIETTQSLVMVGSSEALGEWDVSKGITMTDSKFPMWLSPSLVCTEELLRSEFKFVIVDNITGEVVAWEDGENRRFYGLDNIQEDAILYNVTSTSFNLKPWRGAGVAIPVFSLRSESSMGVGDFMDLKKMVDWAAITKQKIIQILPINDTTMTHTWQDSYPYNANSIFALHPQYISLAAAGRLSDAALQSKYEKEGQELNLLAEIDYEAVTKLKDGYMRQLYSEVGASQLQEDEFKCFFEKNSYWLEPYALFSLLRDKYSTVDFAQWGAEALYSEELLTKYRNEHYEELGYYYFVQYNLHKQLVEVRAYAQTKGVVFKGDIPIGVSRTSVDVWVSPELFHLNSQAGAPPDDFSINGQNWGFPTYNWPEMAKDGYSWWNKRFKKMAEYFDAYRIDHILGFFRIWEIPLDSVHGLLGHFSPAMPFSISELREIYGFQFDESQTKPSINNWIIGEFFKDKAEEVKATYLDYKGNDSYVLKPEYDSQVKIKAAVSDKVLCETLMSLFNELLFIEDPYQKAHYHPRISAQSSYKFRAMSDYDKARFNRAYDDFYYHRHNDFWYKEAMQKLPMLVKTTDMLTCGEDLGMIPDCVPAVMESEQILSLEIQRMPKDPSLTFGEPWNYPYLAVCTTSTHDMDPIRAWLLEDKAVSDNYIKNILGDNSTIEDDASGKVCSLIVEQHLNSPAMWTILPLQDWLSMDEDLRKEDPNSERINIPANSRHYWRYRMHLTIEQLISEEGFNVMVKTMIEDSSR